MQGRFANGRRLRILNVIEDVTGESPVSHAGAGLHRTLSRQRPQVELLADFIGGFDDLTDEPGHAAQNPDPAIGCPAGQGLAEQLRQAGSHGLICSSIRAPAGGSCLV